MECVWTWKWTRDFTLRCAEIPFLILVCACVCVCARVYVSVCVCIHVLDYHVCTCMWRPKDILSMGCEGDCSFTGRSILSMKINTE